MEIALGWLAQNKETAAFPLEDQNSEWRQSARDRRDIAKVAHQHSEPYRPKLSGVVTDQPKDFNNRISDSG